MSSPRTDRQEAPALRVLALCSFNQTRSVMAELFLRDRFDRSRGAGVIAVRSAGFHSSGAPATAHTVAVLRDRGLDASSHRSRRVEIADLASADLVLCAERDHVLRAATIDPGAFARTFTILEFARLVVDTPVAPEADAMSVRAWIESMGSDRDTATYLRGAVAEVADPTGGSRRRFESTAIEIEAASDSIADEIVRRI